MTLLSLFPATLREISHADEAAIAALSDEFGSYKYIDFEGTGRAANSGNTISLASAVLVISAIVSLAF